MEYLTGWQGNLPSKMACRRATVWNTFQHQNGGGWAGFGLPYLLNAYSMAEEFRSSALNIMGGGRIFLNTFQHEGGYSRVPFPEIRSGVWKTLQTGTKVQEFASEN